ncbi:MAG: Hpt domain-containing protein, partial [Steroidobacteraceae bacterium]
MSLDLTQFHGAFFEEGFEALDAMEAALLALDTGAPDPEIINTIFRVAHSIKGGSATFGFGDIASFTHSLETLLDELRGNRLTVSDAISNLLLKSVDVMRDMLRAVQGKLPTDAQRVADLQFDLELAIAQKGAGESGARPADRRGAGGPPEACWRIRFHPYAQFFARGNDPLRMFRELATLGRIEVRTDVLALPPLAELDPQACHMGWEIELRGTATEEAIREVFDWATGESDLDVRRVSTAGDAPAADGPAASAATDPPAAAEAHPSADAHPRTEALARPDAHPAEAHARAAAHPRAETHRADAPTITAIGDTGSIRVSVEKIDELMNTVGELVITQAILSQLGRGLDGPSAEQFRSGLAQLERNMRELQESVMRVRMLPISFVFSRFPRMVRDLAQRLGKQIELKLTG